VPWLRSAEWRDWTDNDDVRLAAWLQGHDINIPPVRVAGAVQAAGSDRDHHPVRDYLEGLKWDGEHRLSGWLYQFMGVTLGDGDQDTRALYVEAIAKKWMIAAVARVMNPGCKVDTCMILESGQGEGKSTALAVLAGEAWFTDQISHVGSKDAAIDLRGKWIIELGELDAMGRAEAETMKAFMSRQIDHYRPPFGRRSIDVPRQCVFAGSTNQDSYLKDETGNRRYWPIKVGKADLDGLAKARDQLWAEAVHRYAAREPWWLTPAENAAAEIEQAARADTDPWQTLIERWLRKNMMGEVEIDTILRDCLQLEVKHWTKREKNRVGACLRAMRWVKGRSTFGDRPSVYRPPPAV
jgi:putative DNA primase/helicase